MIKLRSCCIDRAIAARPRFDIFRYSLNSRSRYLSYGISAFRIEPDNMHEYTQLLYGFSKFSILIGWQAVGKNQYPDRGPYFPCLDRCPGCRLSGWKFRFANRKDFCFLIFQFKIYRKKSQTTKLIFDWACMSTVYCYSVKLTIADLIRAKSICSNTQFRHIINSLLNSLVRSVLWNIRPQFFCIDLAPSSLGPYWKSRSDISQYRPHAQSITIYYHIVLR